MKYQRLGRRRHKKVVGRKIPPQGFTLADLERLERIRLERLDQARDDTPADHGEAHDA